MQAKEFGEAEVWMNERLMRASKRKFAEFLTAFEEDVPGGGGPLWLLWQYEGDSTLADLMTVRSFEALALVVHRRGCFSCMPVKVDIRWASQREFSAGHHRPLQGVAGCYRAEELCQPATRSSSSARCPRWAFELEPWL